MKAVAWILSAFGEGDANKEFFLWRQQREGTGEKFSRVFLGVRKGSGIEASFSWGGDRFKLFQENNKIKHT